MTNTNQPVYNTYCRNSEQKIHSITKIEICEHCNTAVTVRLIIQLFNDNKGLMNEYQTSDHEHTHNHEKSCPEFDREIIGSDFDEVLSRQFFKEQFSSINFETITKRKQKTEIPTFVKARA